MQKEIKLREVPGFPNYYVDDYGYVWTDKRNSQNPEGRLKLAIMYKDFKGYMNVYLMKNGKAYHKKVARLIINAPSGKQVDHIDRNRDNNNIKNLRLCTNSQNQMNTIHNQGKSKYKGVRASKTPSKWIAQITSNRIVYHLGTYNLEIDAATAYNKAALRHHAEFAKLNII